MYYYTCVLILVYMCALVLVFEEEKNEEEIWVVELKNHAGGWKKLEKHEKNRKKIKAK